jgi:hypothetical protein
MKNTVFRDVTPRGSCMNGRFGGTYRLHHQGDKNRRARNNVSLTSNRRVFLRSVFRLLLTANVVSSTPILVTLMLEALLSSETSVLIISIRRNNTEDGILN